MQYLYKKLSKVSKTFGVSGCIKNRNTDALGNYSHFNQYKIGVQDVSQWPFQSLNSNLDHAQSYTHHSITTGTSLSITEGFGAILLFPIYLPSADYPCQIPTWSFYWEQMRQITTLQHLRPPVCVSLWQLSHAFYHSICPTGFQPVLIWLNNIISPTF